MKRRALRRWGKRSAPDLGGIANGGIASGGHVYSGGQFTRNASALPAVLPRSATSLSLNVSHSSQGQIRKLTTSASVADFRSGKEQGRPPTSGRPATSASTNNLRLGSSGSGGGGADGAGPHTPSSVSSSRMVGTPSSQHLSHWGDEGDAPAATGVGRRRPRTSLGTDESDARKQELARTALRLQRVRNAQPHWFILIFIYLFMILV
jgi:hypothetical protein